MKFIKKIVKRWIDESLKEHEVKNERLVAVSVATAAERIGYRYKIGESVAFTLDSYKDDNGRKWVQSESKEGVIVNRNRHTSPYRITEMYSIWVESEKRTYEDVSEHIDHEGNVELVSYA